MKKNRILGLGTLALAGVLAFTGCSVSDEDGKAWAEENGYVKDTAKWAADNGYVKAEDYNIDVDADGYSGSSSNAAALGVQMSQAQIKQLILDQLRGFVLYYVNPTLGEAHADYIKYPRAEAGVYPYTFDEAYHEELLDQGYKPVYSYREMYQIATSYNNVPNISSVEYVIDTSTMKIYGTSEAGTQKVADIVDNPNVSLYWTKQVDESDYFANSADTNDYWRSYGVQIIGTARIIDGTQETELYNKVFDMYMKTMRGAESWDAMAPATKTALGERLKTLNTWYEITPTQYNSHSLWNMYNKDNVCRRAVVTGETLTVTEVACPTGLTSEEDIKQYYIDNPVAGESYGVNSKAALVGGNVVWTANASEGSLHKWSGGLQRKWAKALLGKGYRQVLTDFDETPVYPTEVTDTLA